MVELGKHTNPTFVRTWKNPEAEDLGDGPWSNEPDKAQWVDPATDLDCLVVRGPVGAWCGYVGVSHDHPLYGVNYNDEGGPERYLDVHGGLTFSGFCTGGEFENPHVCHDPLPGRKEVWWLGFDCAHAGDLSPGMRRFNLKFGGFLGSPERNETYRNLAYVADQCTALALQLVDRRPDGGV